MKVELLNYPDSADWMEVKRRALVTVGKDPVYEPDENWKRRILRARHSPIRYLQFSFQIDDVPSWVATHIVRHHVGIQCYVKSQRNDRQNDYDRNAARQDAPVSMIIDINAEALMVLANKRLCTQAALETRTLVAMMCGKAVSVMPEIEQFLVPMCVYNGGVCREMNPCGRW